MNKTELITSIAQESDLTKKDAETLLNAFLKTVSDAMARGEKIQLVGFGSFEVRTRAERKGRNPQTMQEIIIPEKRVPVFRPGKELKELVKND